MAQPETSGELNDLSEAIRTQETRQLLQKLDESLASISINVDASNVANTALFREILNSLQRARKLFGANLFFVVIFGALKSGKSTLTNALVEAEISPMGYGKDTTQRPCLILRGPQAKCCQFFLRRTAKRPVAEDTAPNDASIQDERGKAFDLVTDYLKGVVDQEQFKLKVEIKEFAFSRNELEKKLTSRINSSDLEPLITVVWVTTGSFLSNGICLIDMPGLDSIEHNSDVDSIHDWVIDDADFFLFLQSSVAALNERTQQFLKRIHDSRKQQPMWALQNVLDARYWRDVNVRLAEFEVQRKDASQKLQEVLKHSKENEPKSQWFNLGLEWDGIEQANPEWRKSSRFEEFKSNVTQQLTNERGQIKERNCLDNLEGTFKSALGQLAIIRENQRNLLETFRREEALVKNQLPEEINKLCYFTRERLNQLRKILGHDLDKYNEEMKSKVNNKYVDFKNGDPKPRQMTKTELEKALRKYLTELKSIAENVFAFQGEFQKILEDTIRQHIEDANRDPSISTIDALWKQIDPNVTLSSDFKAINPPQLSKFSCNVDYAIDLTNYHKWLSIMDNVWESTYSADHVVIIFEDYTNRFLRDASESFANWKLKIAEPFEKFDEERREHIKLKLAAEGQALLVRWEPKKSAGELALQNCETLEQSIYRLQPSLENALASF